MDKTLIVALLVEREGYARRGLKQRVADVDTLLAAAGVDTPGTVETASAEPAVETAAVKRSRKRRI